MGQDSHVRDATCTDGPAASIETLARRLLKPRLVGSVKWTFDA